MSEAPRYAIEVEPSVRLTIAEISEYITSQGAPAAAERMIERLAVAIDSLAYFPYRGRSIGRFRELTTVSPYIIRYLVIDQTVRITRIRHGARRSD